jgi:hypothetical protein
MTELESPAEAPGGGGSTPTAVAAARRPGGLRWGVLLAAVAVLVGALAASAWLLTSQSQPEALAYVPSTSVVVVELRPDVPGDQRAALGAVLSRFPGFADQAGVDQKIEQALDQLVQRVTSGKRRYIGGLKAYAAGPMIFAMPTASAGSTGDSGRYGLAVLTTDGSVGCQGLEDGATVTVERHRDVDIRIRSGDGPKLACAASGKFVLIGNAAAIRAGLDARAEGRGIASSARYTAASRAVPGDHLAWAFIDGQGALAALPAASPSARPTLPLPAGAIPEWIAVEVRVTAGGPVFETVTPDPRRTASPSPSAARTARPDAVSAIAPSLPASTIALMEVHDLGGFLGTALASARAVPDAAETIRQLDAALALIGGPQGLLGPLDQAAVAVTLDGGKPGAGLVIQSADATAIGSRLDQVGSLLALAGLKGASSETYHGASLIRIPVAGLLELAGNPMLPGMPGGGSLPGGGLPPGLPGGLPGGVVPSAPPGSQPGGGSIALPNLDLDDAVLVLAVHRGLILGSLGDAFVKQVIDTPAGSSLAEQPAYRSAIELAGSPNSGQAYLDVPALISTFAPLLSGADATTFERDVRPVLQPIVALAMSATSRDGIVRSRMVINIR